MTAVVSFTKTGYYYGRLWVRTLRVTIEEGGNFSFGSYTALTSTIGRNTYLARLLDWLFLEDSFLLSKKHQETLTLNSRDFKLLKWLVELGAGNYGLYKRALEEEWSKEKLISILTLRKLVKGKGKR